VQPLVSSQKKIYEELRSLKEEASRALDEDALEDVDTKLEPYRPKAESETDANMKKFVVMLVAMVTVAMKKKGGEVSSSPSAP